jgi:predicted ATPase
MIKNNFFIITGGPGGGKSSLLEKLSGQGYKHIAETGRQIIKERLHQGLSPRPEPIEFARQMFDKDMENFKINMAYTPLLFFDRSFLDSALLLSMADQNYFNGIREEMETHRCNRKVFITPPWKEIYRNDTERDQTYEEAIAVYNRLYAWYERNGYDLTIIPEDSIESRVNFVLSEVHKQYGHL